MAARTIQVIGGSGGVGASTLAAAIAAHAARLVEGPVVLVDADPVRGMADHAAVLEHVAGLRWHELAPVTGEIDPAALLERLPTGDGMHVLAGCGGPVPPATVAAVLGALSAEAAVLVVDAGPSCLAALPIESPGGVGPPGATGRPRAAGRTTVAEHRLDVLVCGTASGQVVAARRTVEQLVAGQRAAPVVVTRGPRAGAALRQEIAAHVGGRWIGHVPDDPKVRRSAERGRSPATVRALRSVASEVLELTSLAS